MASRQQLISALLGVALFGARVALGLDSQQGSTGAATQERPLAAEPSGLKQIIPPLGIPTLEVTTRMVIVDVLALDKEERPVDGLTADDFRVFEQVGKSGMLPQAIASFRAVERAYGPAALSELLSLPNRSHCWVYEVPSHYELAYYPSKESQDEGVHQISIKCRRGVTLLYRSSYIMTRIAPPAPSPAKTPGANKAPDSVLMSAACGQSPVWTARLHAAYPFASGRPDLLDYFLALDMGQFTFLPQAKDEYQLGVDYAACGTDAARNRLYFAQDKLDGVITKEDYETVTRRGFPFFLEVKKVAGLASVQLVFRDRKTGRMNGVRLAFNADRAAALPAGMLWARAAPEGSNSEVMTLTHGLFGTTDPTPSALCGDVYPLPTGTPILPVFSELYSIGSVYTNSLHVPDQYFGGIWGIPNSSPWFGINYQGMFWLAEPGEYRFELTSDDGAKLYIDDRLIINNDGLHTARTLRGKVYLTAGRHAIRVPYFQGLPIHVALTLRVKAPKEEWTLFDITHFASPAEK